ncbi:trigger factor [Acetatifactor muris]|uniref:Trigger factor n=1 Tax=Acetatifactor muris TaxID=879566 RepID=A0A2K4ZCC7_9FIRM|nr:trigger factor [Acetatifactor muris]MCR2046342.1 trigger factor [Acetatifactor muris]SOY28090.1 Trigger factor [Acetatifactor muris]
MSLQVEKLENNMARLTIEVAAEELEKAIESAYQKNKGKISLPGFRKGKAPRRMLEQMYGKEIFYEDAANELIPDAYEAAYDECGEEIVSSPKIDVVQLEAGKPFIFTAEVALKPEAVLGQYKGIKVDKVDAEVTEEEITAEIDREREKNSRTVDVTDRAIREGDIATIDFEGFVDGEAFEGGKGSDYPLTIGSHTFIPGFEEELIGAEAGQEKEVNVTFPEDYQAAELAGKPAVFKCVVKRLQEKQLPELDDDFVGEVSEESDTVEEYRTEIRNKLADRKTAEAKNAKEESVIDAIIANAQMEIPEPMIETQQRQMVQEYAQRMQSQGISIEQYMQFTGMTREMLLEQVKPQVLKRIQSRLVLEAVAEAENIEVTEEEVNEELKKMGEAYQMEIDKVEEFLGENGRTQVKEDIRVRKAAELVVENAVEE